MKVAFVAGFGPIVRDRGVAAVESPEAAEG